MNRRMIIVAISSLIVGLGVGIGIGYYFNLKPSERKSVTSSSKEESPNLASGTTTARKIKMAAVFNCPCGRCSDKLFECECSTAKEITEYLDSLVDGALSEDEIRNRMVEKYGMSLIGDRDKKEEKNREYIIGNEKPVPPYYEEVEGVALPTILDPEVVSERAKEAYRIAKEFPELLVQLPCYCGCEKARGSRVPHRSLLDCFADRHGENCRICIDEATFARDKMDQGIEPEEIRKAIIEKRGRMHA